MKKTLLSIVALAACFGMAQAEDFITVNTGNYLYGTYPDFSYGNKQVVYIEDDEYESPTETFTILDENFSEKKTIVVEKVKSLTSYDHYYIGPFELTIYDLIHDPECNAVISQTLFNDDEVFEYVMPIVKKGKNQWGEESDLCVGFRIMTENGETLKSAEFPDGLFLTGEIYSNILLANGKIYMYFSDIYDAAGEGYILLYEIKKDESMLSAPMIVPSGAHISPTALRRSETVTVDFTSPLTERCRINVVSTSGRTVASQTVGTGSTNATIDTSRLEPGIYVVNVDDGHSIRENCKIVIR